MEGKMHLSVYSAPVFLCCIFSGSSIHPQPTLKEKSNTSVLGFCSVEIKSHKNQTEVWTEYAHFKSMLLAFLTLYSTALLPLPNGYGSALKFIHRGIDR